MRILLTGAAGFIGSNLSERLLKDGHAVIGVDNFITGSRRNISKFINKSDFEFIEWDVVKPLVIDGKIDWIMHFASPASPPKYLKYPIETLRVNSEGTMNLLELAKRKEASFFLASTSEVYGDPLVHPQAESYWGNVNSYGARSCYDEAKRYAEAMTYTMHKKHGIPVRVIRIFNTYGPKMDLCDGRVVTNFIKQIIENTPITIYGDGKQTRSFQYIDDLIEGIMKLIKTEYYSPVNLGNPEEYCIIDLIEILMEMMEFNLELNFLPLPEDDPKRRNPDITIAKSILGWEPRIKLKDGLKRTIEYFKETIL